jgi:hypothetical protein
MTKRDLAALRECLALAERDPKLAEQLRDRMRDGQLRLERSLFACWLLQSKNLNLKPWQVAPVDAIDDEDELDPAIFRQTGYMAEWRRAHGVVERLRTQNLSPYTADPLAALSRIRSDPPAA